MCGIFGCIGKRSRKLAEECINKISYRGPDALVVIELEDATLAHARLSIIDSNECANQPMADETGRFWIVYNGEIYNYLELKKELELLGHRFRTKSDTEVALHAYLEWREEFQEKCNGMWAMAVWDNVEKKLFLSRDRFGVKPLYYYIDGGNFYFASEMKALFPVMKRKTINYSIFDTHAYYDYEATQQCCIREIKKVCAGYCGYYECGTLHLKRWWCTLDHLIDPPKNYDAQVELFRELFLDACKLRMRSDVPIGTALSGGVDSSAVVGAMRQVAAQGDVHVNKNWHHAFVASMPGTTIDETAFAVMASEYVGANIQQIPITADISVSEIMRYIYVCEDPYVTSPIPFLQTYRHIADAGIHVTLDGHGADEIFGGYPYCMLIAAKYCKKHELEKVWQTYNDMQFQENRLSLPEFEKRAQARKVINSVDMEHASWQELDGLNKSLYVETHERTLPTLLRCYDRYSMGNGLEIRMPFMDYRIVCCAFSIPWTSKLRNGYTKSIVRDAMSPFMDKRIMYRKSKIGFNSPLTEWFQNELKEFLLDTIHSKEFRQCELVKNPLDVAIRVNEFLHNNHGYYREGVLLWEEIIPYLWKKAMIDG